MIPMGIRFWADDKMIYPEKFSVLFDKNTTQSSIRTFIGKEKYDTIEYMLMTPCYEINDLGEKRYVFEKDIVCFQDDIQKTGVVEFNKNFGGFIVFIKEEMIYITEEIKNCKIIGNCYENKEIIEEVLQKKQSDFISTPASIKLEHIKNGFYKEIGKKSEVVLNELEKIVAIDIIETQELKQEIPKEIIEKEESFSMDISDEILKINQEIMNSQPEEVDIFFKSSFEKEKQEGTYVIIIKKNGTEKIIKETKECKDLKEIELLSFIKALNSINEKSFVTICSDNLYLISPFKQNWIEKWMKNDFRKDNGEKIKYEELWNDLILLAKDFTIKFDFVNNFENSYELRKCETTLKKL